MAVFSVDSQRVAASAAHVSTTAERIRQEVATMMADLLDLQASWQGVAQASCASAVEQWQATQVYVEQALDTISVQLHSAAQTYSEAEAHTASLFA
ncbi:WXG100 family type VII secretion target [Schaalia suimastitidis]|uniref:WXG100 family type VII secretion target n=1 Tax=Schaalia suimastitidis TaxID=121163 RepID=UPI0003FA4057|nr:WXG100 family type VII secretion target [Schaalia suimastitidis]